MDTTLAKGQYSPNNFFDEEYSTSLPTYDLHFSNGNINIVFKNEIIVNMEKHDEVKADIELILKIRAMQNRRTFNVKELVFYTQKGTVDAISFFGKCSVKIEDSVSFTLRDKNGNIKYSKEDRISSERLLSSLLTKHIGNTMVKKLISSYYSAIDDDSNLFIYLYEIRDALANNLGGKDNTTKILGISKNDWDSFGKLANNEPIEEGRHRGKSMNVLPATQEQKQKAFSIALDMIIKYVNYLNNGNI